MIDEDRIIQWLLHQKYIGVNEKSTEMTEEFEKEHQWELSRNCFINKAVATIERMEKVDVFEKWIPCSERLPEESDGDFYPAMHVTTTKGIVGWGFYRCDDEAWYLYNEEIQDWEDIESNRIIAWMPLPEPFREVFSL